MMKKLLPCPFCGPQHKTIEPVLIAMVSFNSKGVAEKPHNYKITCRSCELTSPLFFSKADAIREWNCRIGPEE